MQKLNDKNSGPAGENQGAVGYTKAYLAEQGRTGPHAFRERHHEPLGHLSRRTATYFSQNSPKMKGWLALSTEEQV